MSLFSAVELAPRDPILGLNEAFNADTRSTKVNLGVGVYFTDEGTIPVLRAVQEAERPAWRLSLRAATCRSKALPPTTRPCKSCCSAQIPT